jgi:hypothetical protein
MACMNGHRLAEERSLELHREIARQIERDPARIGPARARVEGWLREGSVSRRYAEAWAKLLDGPIEALLGCLRDESETARALRQATPFAGYVDHRRRWQLWREVRARVERNP